MSRSSHGSDHAAWKQSVSKEHRTLTSAYMRRKEGSTLGQSASAPALKPPWGLHDIPEEAPACSASISRNGDRSDQDVAPRLYSSGGRSQASLGSMFRRHGRGIDHRRYTLLSGASSSSPSLRSGAQLMLSEERQRTPLRLPTPSEKSVASSHLTSISQISSASLRREVQQAVQDEVSRAVQPLQERLRNERAKREEAESKLQRASSQSGA